MYPSGSQSSSSRTTLLHRMPWHQFHAASLSNNIFVISVACQLMKMTLSVSLFQTQFWLEDCDECKCLLHKSCFELVKSDSCLNFQDAKTMNPMQHKCIICSNSDFFKIPVSNSHPNCFRLYVHPFCAFKHPDILTLESYLPLQYRLKVESIPLRVSTKNLIFIISIQDGECRFCFAKHNLFKCCSA